MVKALTNMTITSFFEHPENKQYEIMTNGTQKKSVQMQTDKLLNQTTQYLVDELSDDCIVFETEFFVQRVNELTVCMQAHTAIIQSL